MWSHAIHNLLCTRKNNPCSLAICLTNSIITLTSKGHTLLFSRFRLISNKIRPAWVAPHVIETEKKNRTDYQVSTYRLKKWNTYFNEKSKVTVLTYIHMISYEYEYFRSTRTLVTKSSTIDHNAHLCFASYKIEVSHAAYKERWVSMESSFSQLTFFIL